MFLAILTCIGVNGVITAIARSLIKGQSRLFLIVAQAMRAILGEHVGLSFDLFCVDFTRVERCLCDQVNLRSARRVFLNAWLSYC